MDDGLVGAFKVNRADRASAGPLSSIINGFRAHTATIGVIGLGYVGLPLACTAAGKGFQVLGFDIDVRKVDQINAGTSYINQIGNGVIAELQRTGRLSATADFSRLAEVDAIILCVPTPLTRQREPDLTCVMHTAESIAPYLRRGQLIVLESTSYPGTTREIMRPILERNGLRSGHDFFLAYSPEREDPGNAEFSTSDIPKVVGGDGPDALRLACALYDEVVAHTVPVSSLEAAEAVKLSENIFRSVNIALANELKTVFDAMGIDVWEIIEAAKTKPFGYMPFYPGPGLGGHCIPIDPFYLTWKAREYRQEPRLIESAGEVNTAMPAYVVNRVAEALKGRQKTLKDSSVLVLGLAYKPNVDDERESPSYVLMDLLSERGAQVEYYDPFVPVIKPTREHSHWADKKSVSWDRATVESFDLVLIATNHSCVNYQELADWAQRIVDTRNAMASTKVAPGKVWKA